MGENQAKRRQRDESRLFRVVITTVAVFLLCWSPAILFEYITTRKSTSKYKLGLLMFKNVELRFFIRSLL